MLRSSHLRLLFLLLPLLFGVGCGGALVRVGPLDATKRPAGPPRIDRAVDLGALPLAEQGPLATDHSDKLFTPGEWFALFGANLVEQPRVSIAGQAIVPAGALSSGALLLRMPRGLGPGMQVLSLDNGLGTATVTLPTALYAFGADTSGNALHFRRLGPEGDGFTEREVDIELPRARFTALSSDGGLLYAIQEFETDVSLVPAAINTVVAAAKSGGDSSGACELMVVHMGGKTEPKKILSMPLTLASKPTGLALSPRGQLVILQKRNLSVIDASDPLKPRMVSQMPLTGPAEEREIIDAEFLGQGRFLAVLEAFANQVLLIDLQNPQQPRPLPVMQLSRAVGEPFSIDLVAAADGQSLWVLQGPNLRLGGKRLVDGLATAWSDVKTLQFQAAAKAVGETAVGTAMLPRESLSRLVQLTFEGEALHLAKSITLPSEIFPFFIAPDRDGSLYVSGIQRTNPFADVQASLDGLLKLLQGLKSAAQLGAVLKVGTEDGRVTTVLQGMAIYYDLALLGSGQLLVSTLRLGPGYLPPRLTLDWGLEIAGGPFTKLREVANTGFKITDALQRLLPPYRYERIGAQ